MAEAQPRRSVRGTQRDASTDVVGAVLRRYWGYDRLRPLQAEAIQAALAGQDALVVLPTGGGKSLCYQIPPAVAGRTDVVISPLIALMKDQVDGLRACGYPAVALHSGLSGEERSAAWRMIARREARLIFLAPERALSPRIVGMLADLEVRAFAIDEAHCVSHWGHDFRPEYRSLADLRRHFPQASLHAYTATATPRVREDIAEQLGLREPRVLIGAFDRPNLVYRVQPAVDVRPQVRDALARHRGQAAIVYCLSRRDTEAMAAYLQQAGVRAGHYHAGMDADERGRTQEAFSREQLDVIVATVAFGMGIDRSDVRCVIHASIPKSLEHYQQEAGRAGRDGLEAECLVLYSPADGYRWEGLIQKSIDEGRLHGPAAQAAFGLLEHMQAYCSRPICRHAQLSRYFGQELERTDCGACDVCLGELPETFDGTVVAQKILSCVARVQQRFGVQHVCEVLAGSNSERVRACGHQELSTHGLLRDFDRATIKDLVHQAIEQQLLTRTRGEKPIIQLTSSGLAVMRGQQAVRFRRPVQRVQRAAAESEAWAGVDEALFERLRGLRRKLASERGVPPYLIFNDRTLRAMAKLQPSTVRELGQVPGVGRQKLRDFGNVVLAEIRSHSDVRGRVVDERAALGRTDGAAEGSAARGVAERGVAERAFACFRQRMTVAEAARSLGRSERKVRKLLVEFVAVEPPADLSPWVGPDLYAEVAEVWRMERVGTGRAHTLAEGLGQAVAADDLRLIVAHLQAAAEGGGTGRHD